MGQIFHFLLSIANKLRTCQVFYLFQHSGDMDSHAFKLTVLPGNNYCMYSRGWFGEVGDGGHFVQVRFTHIYLNLGGVETSPLRTSRDSSSLRELVSVHTR
jgi:hypothetical protein